MSSTKNDGQKSSTIQRTAFPSAFYVANTMEIFERLSWYGIYTLLAVYLTSSKGLGLTPNEQSLIMGVGTFLLYIVPVFAGALADRFGYKTMFLAAFSILVPAYYLLGQATTFTGFFLLFLMVAIGGGMFKPVVTGTVGRSTDDTNRGLGFGIFYMMVNIGGAAGPIVAQWVKGDLGWSWAFTMASIWIAINFIPALFFYKDPLAKQKSSTRSNKSIKQVFQEMQQVLGNARLALFVIPALTLCCLKAGKLIGVNGLAIGLAILIVINFTWSLTASSAKQAPWYRQKIKVGNKPFVVYLLILSGFWTVYNQVFYSFPLYVQHYVNSSDLIEAAEHTGSKSFVNYLTGIKVEQLTQDLIAVANKVDRSNLPTERKTQQAYILLSELQIKVPKAEILPSLQIIQQGTAEADKLTQELYESYNQNFKVAEIRKYLVTLAEQFVVDGKLSAQHQTELASAIKSYGLKIPAQELTRALTSVKHASDTARKFATHWEAKYKQADPQIILVLEFLAIVLLQIFISSFISRWRPLPILIGGTLILSFGLWIGGFSHMLVFGGFAAATSVVIFAIGEIIASPKSQEYVASFAPKENVGMYMGYYFVSIALGNLFAGILSGALYSSLVIESGQPVMFWSVFGLLGFLTLLAFYIFDKTMVHQLENNKPVSLQASEANAT